MQIRKTYRGEAEVFTEALNDILFILLMFFLIVATLANPNVIKLSQPKSQGDTKAKQTVDLERFKQQMEGIFSTSVCKSTLDEAPDVYKDAELIELAIEPTCEVLEHIRPVYNAKDKSEDLSWKEKRVKQQKDRHAERKAKREAGRKAMEG